MLLHYTPPFGWDRLLGFWSDRAMRGVEKVEDSAYSRTVEIDDPTGASLLGWMRLSHIEDEQALQLTWSDSLLPVKDELILRARRMFDLDHDPNDSDPTLSKMNQIKEGLFVPGTRIPGAFHPFEASVRIILGQQITVKAATTIAGRVAERLGTPIKSGILGLDYAFPTAQSILALGDEAPDVLGSLGVTGRRSQTIIQLAILFQDPDFSLSLESPEETIKELLEIPGIGPWTAHALAMRVMKWPDAFPGTDYGVKKALEPMNPKEIEQLAEQWRPWRAYAVTNLWGTL